MFDRYALPRHAAPTGVPGTALKPLLAERFPTVRRLLGAANFQALAADYAAQPQSGGDPATFGGGFPDHLADRYFRTPWAHLPDVARFDWAMRSARLAPEAPRLTLASLRRIAPPLRERVVFAAHPSLRLFVADWPVDEIGASDGAASPTPRETRLAILRTSAGEVVALGLDRADFTFLRWLKTAWPLREADHAVRRQHDDFDHVPILDRLTAAGAFSLCHVSLPTRKAH